MTATCRCGGIRISVSGKVGPLVYCHCHRCQKSSGSAFSANVNVRRKYWDLVGGANLVREFESSPGVYRAFCSACGPPVYSRWDSQPESSAFDSGCSTRIPGGVVSRTFGSDRRRRGSTSAVLYRSSKAARRITRRSSPSCCEGSFDVARFSARWERCHETHVDDHPSLRSPNDGTPGTGLLLDGYYVTISASKRVLPRRPPRSSTGASAIRRVVACSSFSTPPTSGMTTTTCSRAASGSRSSHGRSRMAWSSCFSICTETSGISCSATPSNPPSERK